LQNDNDSNSITIDVMKVVRPSPKKGNGNYDIIELLKALINNISRALFTGGPQ